MASISSISSVSKDASFIDPTDMDTSSSVTSSPTLAAKPLVGTTVAEEHPLYYFHDGSFAFVLEGIKYNVHSSLLSRHCGFTSTWAEDLSDPTSAGITRADIDAFLSMIYIATYEYVEMTLSTKPWTSILRLATMWKAAALREFAIRMLSSRVSALEKLLLCREYDIPEWLAPACAAVALRPSPPTMAEAEQFEKSDIVRVFSVREAVFKGYVEPTEGAVSAWITGLLSDSERSTRPHGGTTPIHTPTPFVAATDTPNVLPTISSATSLAQPSSKESQLSETEDPTRSTLREDAAPATSQSKGTPHAGDAPSPEEALRQHLALNPSISPFPSSTTAPASTSVSHDAGPSGVDTPHALSVQEITPPVISVCTPEGKITHAVDAILAQRNDEAVASLTMDNLKAVATQVAPSLITHIPQRPGVGNIKRLRALLRAVMRRVVTSPAFIPCGAQFVLALSTQPTLSGVRFEDALRVDMQSLASNWAVFKAGGQPPIDVGNVMADLSTASRKFYQAQIGHCKGFLRTLVRLRVLPAANADVEMLV